MHFTRFTRLQHDVALSAGAFADEVMVQATDSQQGWNWSFRLADATVRKNEDVFPFSDELVSLSAKVVHGFF